MGGGHRGDMGEEGHQEAACPGQQDADALGQARNREQGEKKAHGREQGHQRQHHHIRHGAPQWNTSMKEGQQGQRRQPGRCETGGGERVLSQQRSHQAC